uniref:Serine/threonine-protein phosphatase 7 long form homolog n=1 Tax=Cicer arietinum TaxID=3827 RepID=A0A1S2Z4K7_CICAR|nr:serine/threonine-protein phosphatase 7 long form homolog [Cicer arietinum]
MKGISTYASSKHALYALHFFPYPCDVYAKNKVGARGRDGKIIRITRDTDTSTSTPMNPPERIRPTASRRRRRMIIEDDDEGHNDQGESSTVHEEHVEEVAPAHEGEHMEEEHDGAEGPGELTRYPGGPYDLSVLTRYRYHVSARLWFGEERPLLKIVAHGKKMQQFTPPVLPRPIENWVNLSGLNPLQRGSLKMIDNNLISAFVERWHSETSSFHMPFGEMTITLDDVANLLGLPIRGEFYSPPDVDRVTACNLVVHLLGVTTEEIWEETRKTRGAHYRLDWLKEVFRRQCADLKLHLLTLSPLALDFSSISQVCFAVVTLKILSRLASSTL